MQAAEDSPTVSLSTIGPSPSPSSQIKRRKSDTLSSRCRFNNVQRAHLNYVEGIASILLFEVTFLFPTLPTFLVADRPSFWIVSSFPECFSLDSRPLLEPSTLLEGRCMGLAIQGKVWSSIRG